jgi:putative endonuclease
LIQSDQGNKELNREKGAQTEKMAEDLLLSKNYSIIKKNFRYGKVGEIDIIAKDKDILVFVEVKSAFNQNFGFAVQRVDFRKQTIIKKVANAYLYFNKITNVQCRFDVITIDKINDELKIEHYVNAFY